DSEAEAADAARRAAADIETLPSPEAGVGSVTGMPKPGDPGTRHEVAAVDTGAEATPAADVEMDVDVERGMVDESVVESMEADADADTGVVADAGALPLPPPQPEAVVVPLERGQPLPP